MGVGRRAMTKVLAHQDGRIKTAGNDAHPRRRIWVPIAGASGACLRLMLDAVISWHQTEGRPCPFSAFSVSVRAYPARTGRVKLSRGEMPAWRAWRLVKARK